MSLAYKKKQTCKTEEKQYANARLLHFLVVADVGILDDNTIYPYDSVICNTTLSKVYHIEV